MKERTLPELPPNGNPISVIIDTDAANEIDDLYAIALALASPERFHIEGFVATHFAQVAGRESIELSFRLLHDLLAAGGLQEKYPVLRGGDPLPYLTSASESEGAQFIISRAMAHSESDPLWILGLGAASNIASALLLAPEIIPRIRVVYHARSEASWPERSRQFNVGGDIHAVRVLLESGVPLVWFDTGQQLTCPMSLTEQKLAHLDGIQAFLHEYRYRDADYQSDKKGFYDLADVAWMLDPSVCTQEFCDVPHMDWRMEFWHQHDLGQMLRITDAQPTPIWEMFFDRMNRL